jgi:hypothetical protein
VANPLKADTVASRPLSGKQNPPQHQLIGAQTIWGRLATGDFSRHRTICDFRKQHLDAFKAAFIQVVRIAREVELITLAINYGCQ